MPQDEDETTKGLVTAILGKSIALRAESQT
jgi:hypothetical protein